MHVRVFVQNPYNFHRLNPEASNLDLLIYPTQKRDLAMKKYQTVLAGNANTGPADEARRYIKEAYRE